MILLIAMGASRADAEDAVQEAMILAWSQWNAIEEPAAWVRTVAVRKHWKQARSRRQTVPLEEVAEFASDNDLATLAEEQQQVLRLLRNLPAQQRTVAALHFDGLAYEDIAELTGKSPATVRSNLRHARNALKELVASGAL